MRKSHGKQSFTIFEAAYEYAFVRSDKYELAGSIGLHYTSFEATLRADVPAPGGGGTVSLGGPAKVDAPLPVVGAHGMWRMGGNFYLDAQAQFFALSFDGYDGNIVNYRAAFTWQPKRSVGIGLGYDNFTIDVDVDKANFDGLDGLDVFRATGLFQPVVLVAAGLCQLGRSPSARATADRRGSASGRVTSAVSSWKYQRA